MRASSNDVKDMTTTLTRFQAQAQEQDEFFEEGDENELDSDDEEPLAQRLQGINLEDAESVWNNLTAEERSEFQQFVASVKAEELVEEWIPWWCKQPVAPKLVQDLSKTAEDKKSDEEEGNCQPSILESIPTMMSLTVGVK